MARPDPRTLRTAARVLQAVLACWPDEVSVREIADRSGVPLRTVYRSVDRLVAWRLLRAYHDDVTLYGIPAMATREALAYAAPPSPLAPFTEGEGGYNYAHPYRHRRLVNGVLRHPAWHRPHQTGACRPPRDIPGIVAATTQAREGIADGRSIAEVTCHVALAAILRDVEAGE